jgi:hypothetical protein
MRRLRLTIGARERMELAIVEAPPLGLLGTEAVVRIGAAEIRGSATALAAPGRRGPAMLTKRCYDCGQVKRLELFDIDRHTRTGRSGQCKA